MKKFLQWLALGIVLPGVQLVAQAQVVDPPLPVMRVEHGANSAAAQKAHYVVLVSLDGFRWDYPARYGAPHLMALAKEGVWAPQGMLPSYPSLTFPNHYTLVTGLYPEHHGLIGNAFLDQSRHGRYALSDAQAVRDGSWYGGVPLWSLAESQGMRTACFFWPGSEAEIAGQRPSYYLHFDDKIDAERRIAQVIAWLKLPAAERPHLITLYYASPDHEGHGFGPDAPETAAAVARVDALIGKLQAALDATALPVDLVVVSDHGMAKIEGDWITLDKFADLRGFETEGSLLYGKSEAERERVYRQLKNASPLFSVYRLKDLPKELHFNENARAGDPVIVPNGPYLIRAHAPEAGTQTGSQLRGMHGYNPRTMPEMKASFFAVGPDLAQGKTVAPFENVNLYPWLAHLLGLTPAHNDGSFSVLEPLLK